MQKLEGYHIKIGEGRLQVELRATLCGNDVGIVCGGGQAYHIGAVALAAPRVSHLDVCKISASASVLCAFGHKEDQLARDGANKIAAALNTMVSLSLGLHVDYATPQDMQALSVNFWQGVDELIGLLQPSLQQADEPELAQNPKNQAYRPSGPVGHRPGSK